LFLFIFEFLGTNEVLVILVVALILLGPRKLPEMSRKIGKSIAEFKRTSEEFKRTWEKEIDLESMDREIVTAPALLSSQNSILNTTIERGSVAVPLTETNTEEDQHDDNVERLPEPSVTPVDPSVMQTRPETASDEPVPTVPSRKRDWL
jgi:sec-independent protein translocase protein TatB